jgi:hypothetical protein
MAGTDLRKAFGHLGAIAQRAVDRAPLVLSTADCVENPRTDLERWTMAEMLVMATGDLTNPVAEVILVVSGDCPFHAIQPMHNTDRPLHHQTLPVPTEGTHAVASQASSFVQGGGNQCWRPGKVSR